MKNFNMFYRLVLFSVLMIIPFKTFAQVDDQTIIPLYTGSEIRDDHKIGFEEFSFVIDNSTLQKTEGNLRRVFCVAPESRSPLEAIKNYEKAIKDMNGTILFVTRDPRKIKINDISFETIFKKNRKDPGLSTGVFTQTSFPELITEYLVGKIKYGGKDVYIIVAAGPGAWAASEDKKTFYELITLEAEPMEMGMITPTDIGKGLAADGRIAIYSILFDIGKADVKSESSGTLKAIADYLNSNKTQKVLIVGHTDNTGDFDMNIKLSKDRADAVVAKLVNEYGVSNDQLKPFGAGSVSPVQSNKTEEGRTQNRRVEIVEQ